MAGRGKVAVLATLMFALLLSSSLIEAARPIVSEGSNVAADGSVMVRDPHSRQLRFFWRGWGWGGWFGGCGWFWWGGCNRGFVQPVFVKHDDDHKRKLNTFFRPWWHGWGGWGWGGWGWGGWGGFGGPYWGRK